MPERVGGDRADSLFTERLAHPQAHDVAPGGSRDRLDLAPRAFVVAGKQGQGGDGAARSAVETGAGRKVVPKRSQGAAGEDR